MSAPFRWAFIGTGTLANKIWKQLESSGRHSIVTVYSRNEEKCARFAKKVGAEACKSAAEAIERDDVDGVYIVTPHTSHFVYAKQALEAGKPVLCEKPVTVNAADARELVRIAREKNLYFCEAMWTWFGAVPNQVKKWLDEGAFGELTEVNTVCRTPSFGYAPRVTDPALAGGALLDMGVYPITFLYRMFGKPAQVKCVGKIEKGIDWEEKVTLIYEDGREYVTDISIRALAGTPWFGIKGTKASTIVRPMLFADHAVLNREDGTMERFEGRFNYLNEFDLVSEEIREGLTESRYIPHSATLDVMEIMDECRRQMGLVYPFER